MNRTTRVLIAGVLVLGGLYLIGRTPAHADTICPGAIISQPVQVQQVTGSPEVSSAQSAPMNGADLGVAWFDGVSVLHAFGDNGTSVQPAFSGPTLGGYQPNAVGFDRNSDISQGIQFAWPGIVRPAVPLFTSSEDGVVPTGAIHANGKDYMKYVVFPHGHTTQDQTRANGMAESDDGGLHWYRVYNAVWNNNGTYTDNFQQQALALGPDGYIYVYSTRSGRNGDVYLMRVLPSSILTQSAYQYWTGSAWSSVESAAQAIFPGPAGEMSAMYLPAANKWVAMYSDDHGTNHGEIVLRYASSPTGPWSAPQPVLSDNIRPIYAPMIDPRSTATDLYFYGSDWNTYQTYLFRSTMSLP